MTFGSQTQTVCTASGSEASLIASGVCTIAANQPGNASYAAAPTVIQSFNVTALAQTIDFPAIADRTLGDPPFGGNTVTLLAAAFCTLEATQSGDSQYSAAPSVMQTSA